MRLATWNVNSLRARMGKVTQWLHYARPDVVCLQETKMKDSEFPYGEFLAQGYSAVHFGFSQWNGVALLSKGDIADAVLGMSSSIEETQEARVISATTFGMRVFSVYVPNGRAVGDPHFEYKLRFLEELRSEVGKALELYKDVVLAGDFNIAPKDIDVWSIDSLIGATHVTKEERGALDAILEAGFIDAFRYLYPSPGLYSWWDYRDGAFHKGHGMRIDLTLVSSSLQGRCVWGLVDRNARKIDRDGAKPSDHAPVLLDLID